MATIVYNQSQDQGTEEIVAIVRDLRPDAQIEVVDVPGGRKLTTDPIHLSFIQGMEWMIGLMSPGGADMTMEREALRRLQRLIYSNLGCIKPVLEAYEE